MAARGRLLRQVEHRYNRKAAGCSRLSAFSYQLSAKAFCREEAHEAQDGARLVALGGFGVFSR